MSSRQVWTQKIRCHRQLHNSTFQLLPRKQPLTVSSWLSSSYMPVWTPYSSSSIRHVSNQNRITPEQPQQQPQQESAIFPRPLPDPDNARYAPLQLPKTWEGWKTVWNGAWTEYKNSWQGFALGGREVVPTSEPEKGGVEQELDNLETKFTKVRGDIQSNVERNLKVIQKDGTELVETLQDRTGIYTTEDLKKWVADQMKLATECLSQFMAGYRTGRDDEIDKMLHEYFKELEGEENEDETEKESETRNPKP
eukprot:CAMPEP_0195301176 /NCGR_PEP_ID=MMETSP0707-20130614/28808_1 /TAXON_ID=33640 /ORGANISM="Asterionellopsis glacialis, Strain CCMP134" /LENGTH=251 /DNA_ID=CAMNT_0040364047 /DNA_START=243 /DNA_END=994 /DNA_ORIENTATION=-